MELENKRQLSQNFDVSPISSVTHEAREQPPEREHYEKKDTDLNNRQKQEENKSSEKSNEKKWKEKRKKRIFRKR